VETLLNSALTIIPIAWGLVVKYHPAWKSVPNAIIPYVTWLAALLTKMVAPAEAHAADFVVAGGVALVPMALPGFLAWTAPVLTSGWQAIQNALIYEVFLRGPAGAVWKKQ
jgi:hypothetical protein